MTIKEKLTTINNALNSIKQAIIAKGGTPSGNITTYSTAISNINTVNNTDLFVTPSKISQSISPTAPYTGFDVVNVESVGASIDSNITAGNIKKDVTILGVTGTYEGSGGGSNAVLTISVEDHSNTLGMNYFYKSNWHITNIKFNNVSYMDNIGYMGASSGYDMYGGTVVLPKNTTISYEISLASGIELDYASLNGTGINISGSFTLTADTNTLSMTIMDEGGIL